MKDRQLTMIFELFAGLLGAQEVMARLLVERGRLDRDELIASLQALLERTRKEMPDTIALLPVGHLIKALEPPSEHSPESPPRTSGIPHPPWLRDIIEGGLSHAGDEDKD